MATREPGLHVALHDFARSVTLGLVADPEAFHRSAVQMVADDRRRGQRHGADFQTAKGVEGHIPGAFVKNLADEMGRLREDLHHLAVDVVVAHGPGRQAERAALE